MKKERDNQVDLLEEIGALRGDISALRMDIMNSPNMIPHSVTKPPAQLNVFLACTSSPRKPYLLKIQGLFDVELKLSKVRAAIFTILLVDLQERSEGGDGLDSPQEKVLWAYRYLTDDASADSQPAEHSVRVALYRFYDYFESEFNSSFGRYRLVLNEQRLRVDVVDSEENSSEKTDEASPVAVNLLLSTNDSKIKFLLESSSTISVLTRVRRRKALYVSPGEQGVDKLLLEMYDHDHHLKVTSLYVRPPFPSYPTDLLKSIGVSDRVLQRKELAFQGYKTGRFHFYEILQKRVIWDLIRYSPEQGFLQYPRNIETKDVLYHLQNLVEILQEYDNYNFYLTDAPIPFVLVSYEIKSAALPEYFTVFFQSFQSAAASDLGCFVMNDPLVHQSITDNIIDWVLEHPSTLRKRNDVTDYLELVIRHLQEKGPLAPGEKQPETDYLLQGSSPLYGR
jgi:hypothetical protein